MANPPAVSVVLCTVPQERAEALVDVLLEQRLIACANLIGPMRSRYRWQGRIESAEEVLLVMKAPTQRFEELRDAIVREHGYSVPEILALPVESGLDAYLAWVHAECRTGGPGA